MKKSLLLFLFCFLILPPLNNFATANSLPVTGNTYDLHYHRLQIEIDPAVKFIKGCITSYFTIRPGSDALTFDLANNLQVDSVLYRGAQQSFTHENDILRIDIPLVSTMQVDSVKVYYQGVPLGGLFFKYQRYWDDNTNRYITDTSKPLAYSDSEPYDSHQWWPCKQSLTDKIDSIDLFITTPSVYKAAANGLLQSEVNEMMFTTYHWKHRYPIATYLVACSVSDYVVHTNTVTLQSGRNMPMINYIFPAIEQRSIDSIAAFIPILQFLDSLLGPYPFETEKYGHAQAPTGMENQTISFVSDFNKGLLSHELTHQWFGDKVTCASWHDLWLNEGFATYLPMLLIEAGIDQSKTAEASRSELINFLVPFNATMTVHVNDTSSYESIFGMGPYIKGAMVLHMIRMKIGSEAFFQGLRNYLHDPLLAYGFSSLEKLQQHLENVSGQSLSTFLSEWYYGEGYPVFHVTWNQTADHALHLYLQQVQETNVSFFHEVPLQLTFYNADRSMAFDTTLYVLQHQEYVMLDPGFAVDQIEFDRNKNIVGQYTATFDPSLQLVSTAITSTSPSPATNAPIPVAITFSESMTGFDAGDLSINGGTVQHFQGNGITYTFDLNPTFTGLINITVPGNTAISINGNKNATATFTINYTGEITGNTIPSQQTGIRVYPIPAAAAITVTAGKTIEHLELLDMLGQQVFTQSSSDETVQLDVSTLKSGVYVLRVWTGNHDIHKQLIIKK